MQGARLGPYRIDRELGSGGMGRGCAATGAEGVVALKVVHPRQLETPGFFERFVREAQLGQSIRHENVVRTLDCDQALLRAAKTALDAALARLPVPYRDAACASTARS